MANPFFKAEYYLAQNEDLAAAFGDDHAAAEVHYFTHGAVEAENGAPSRKPAEWFDINYYRANNEDLAGLSSAELFTHFVNNGAREGRAPMEGVELDLAAYASANQDLMDAFGITDPDALTPEQMQALAQHFYSVGYKESREGAPEIPEDVVPVDRTELAEALKNISDAEDALEEFLEENEAEEPAEILAARDAALQNLDDDYENGSDARLEANIVLAEANLAAAQENFDAALADSDEDAVDNFVAARAAYEKGMNDLRAAKADRDEAQAAAMAQVDTFIAANPDYDFDAKWALADTDDGNTPSQLGLFVLGMIVVGDKLVPADDPDTAAPIQLVKFDGDATSGRVVATDEGELFAGINQLVATVNDWLIESDAVNAQQDIVGNMEDADPAGDTLTDKLYAADLQLEGGTSDEEGPLWNLLNRETDLENAHKAVANRQELKDKLAAAEALVDELEALLADGEAAWDALEALGYESIDIIEAGDTLTASGEGQIFVYDPDEDDDTDIGASISNFGQDADDVLYFDASEFTYNDGDIEDGDNHALEFFLVQDGDNVNVLFEKTEYGSASEEFDTITLVGVDIENVVVDDLGFISL